MVKAKSKGKNGWPMKWYWKIAFGILVMTTLVNTVINSVNLTREAVYNRRTVTRGLLMKVEVEILGARPLTPEERSKLEKAAKDAELP